MLAFKAQGCWVKFDTADPDFQSSGPALVAPAKMGEAIWREAETNQGYNIKLADRWEGTNAEIDR